MAEYYASASADNVEHAEEQLINAEPDADTVWVAATDNYQDALDDDYYNNAYPHWKNNQGRPR